uniref:Uncharacterized protein n=1 Tax=Arundo donax TaxID=35708 RepID=A0A0A9B3X4_ARUDO
MAQRTGRQTMCTRDTHISALACTLVLGVLSSLPLGSRESLGVREICMCSSMTDNSVHSS